MIRSLTYLLLLLPVILAGQTAGAQSPTDIRQAEVALNEILAGINSAGSDSLRDALNQQFSKVLEEALPLTEAVAGAFSSIKSLVQTGSPDKRFMIYHWNLPDAQGSHRYYGFIRLAGKEGPRVIRLTDTARVLPMPDTLLLDQDHWFGALYYKVIENESPGGEKFYTLLGWSGKDKGLTQKVIEILSFDASGNAWFGKRIFPGYRDGKMTRIIFSFAATSSMSMKYENQAPKAGKKLSQGNRSSGSGEREQGMIVCEKVVPMDPQLEGQYRFYVAAGSEWDGFQYHDGAWHYIPDIDATTKK